MFILDTMTEMLRRCQEEYSFAEENDSSLHVKMWDFEFFFCVCVRDGCGIFKAFLKWQWEGEGGLKNLWNRVTSFMDAS